MRDNELSDIRQLPLFRSMSNENYATLTRAAYDQTFPAQVQLFEEASGADFLHIVMDGAVELFAGWQDRETTLEVIRPVTTFILAACITDSPYLMSARTLEKTRIIMMPTVDVRTVFDKDPAFALAAMTELSACYRRIIRHAKDIKLRNARERVAAYLLRTAPAEPTNASFVLPLEKRLLASFIGMTPESLSRAMRSLQELGVKVEGQRITIANRAALESLAHPSWLIDGPDLQNSQTRGP
ncbi:helix-turn-helix domain-containing protein [Phaeovulum sp.]|uniref:helix-turn-helix domain-containing protein n=1 Tax=Phaeovulum sp. TaxID=2934796 RepID=UPI0039E6D748